ncbi:hypothetical protein [Chryseobacterium phocaeense]|nr:hypothetical protein [Chryseobacterium phocaeense]
MEQILWKLNDWGKLLIPENTEV